MALSRRAFLGLSGGAAAVAVGGGVAWRALVDDSIDRSTASDPSTSSTSRTSATGENPGRVLVVVQLGGGNDGLNTLVPAGDGRYYDHRPNLAVAENEVIALSGVTGYGLNPALAPLAPHWSQGRLAMVEGVGFPGQSRSHFQASDTWWTASLDNTARTGWLGRWLDAVGAVDDPLRAVAIGAGSPALLVAEHARSTVVLDPTGFALRIPDGVEARHFSDAFRSTSAPLSSDPVVAAAQRAVPGTLDAVSTLAPALDGASTEDGAVEEGDITTYLRVAGQIIGLGLSTQIIVVSVSGFDTHANEGAAHPILLADLAKGLDELLLAVDQQGRADDVLVVTTSEFGRRVQENGSGTDHGKASVAMLAGGPVASTATPGGEVTGGLLVGQADLGALDDGDLEVGIDTRCLYAAALDWLGGPTDELLGDTYDRHALVRT